MDTDTLHTVQHAFIHTDRLHRTVVENAISSLGLHRSQHMLLFHLSRLKQTPTQKELADFFQISSAAVAVTLKKMEQNGYISRKCGGDMRCNKITITQKGQEMLSRSKELVEQIDETMYKGFSRAELDTLYSYLIRMQNNLQNTQQDTP